MTEITPAQTYAFVPDFGHVAICLGCYQRHSFHENLIGKEREIKVTPCQKCIEKKVSKYEQYNGFRF